MGNYMIYMGLKDFIVFNVVAAPVAYLSRVYPLSARSWISPNGRRGLQTHGRMNHLQRTFRVRCALWPTRKKANVWELEVLALEAKLKP